MKCSSFRLEEEEKGYFSGLIKEATEGTLYRFRLNGEDILYPDPASRFQPQGPHGPSQVVDPSKFKWNDQHWKGVALEGRVIYEMHIGTFTQQGTWVSAKQELLELADLGITIIEMMPVNEFPGKFGWGYDGVNLFAPTHLYGSPDDLRDFIDHAHALGIAVILDVVYNHFGPDGNYLRAFADHYFTHRYVTEWGDAINFDGPDSEEVREFYIANAGYWIDEFHFDGLRIDATQNIYDLLLLIFSLKLASKCVKWHLIAKHILLQKMNRNKQNLFILLKREDMALMLLWNDDFHHSAFVRLTGRMKAIIPIIWEPLKNSSLPLNMAFFIKDNGIYGKKKDEEHQACILIQQLLLPLYKIMIKLPIQLMAYAFII